MLRFFVGAAVAQAVAAGGSSIVTIADGHLRGTVTPHFRSFRGIPYAHPPLAKRRWAPPDTANISWDGVLDATEYKHNCLQSSNFDPAQPLNTLSEDCLYLNVFTPSGASATSKLPVMVWVHGGGYQGGGANESRLNGTFDVALTNDMIVVTLNYRLNVFGFLGAQVLRAKDKVAGSTGNYGILDQRAALQWVQSNIHAFGGDKARVLLVGESAGGASVHNHLVRPKSWGLFSRAAIESGGYTLVDPQPTRSDFEADYATLLNLTGCSTLACLEDLDAVKLLNIGLKESAQVPGKDGFHMNFQPSVDGVDLTDQIVTLLAKGQLPPKVPLLVGSVAEDLNFIVGSPSCKPSECDQADFERLATSLKPTYPDLDVANVTRIYDTAEVKLPGGDYSKWYWAAFHLGSDATMICPARRTAMWLTAARAASADAYLFHFSHVPGGSSGAYPSLAHHSCEIPFVFHVLEAHGPSADEYYMHGEQEIAFSAKMVRYWRNFASSGNPNVHATEATLVEGSDDLPRATAEALPLWPKYSHDGSDQTMVFGDDDKGMPHVAAKRGVKREQCDYWDMLYGWKDGGPPPPRHHGVAAGNTARSLWG